MTRYAFPARYLVELRHFIHDEETRYYLEGVAIEPRGDGFVLAATDGHVLAVADPEGGGMALADGEGKPHRTIVNLKNRLVPFSFIKGAANTWALVDTVAQSLTIGRLPEDSALSCLAGGFDGSKHNAYVVIERALIDGAFPDFPRVVPKGPFRRSAATTFQPHVLMKFYTAFRSENQITAVSIYDSGKEDGTSPQFVLMPSRDDVFGVLMPCRPVFSEPALPGWWTAAEPAEVKPS